MAIWKTTDVCPLIANAILDVYETSGKPAEPGELTAALLEDRLARRYIDEAARSQRRPAERIVVNMVNWFNSEYTAALKLGSSHVCWDYVSRFQRLGTVGSYTFAPVGEEA